MNNNLLFKKPVENINTVVKYLVVKIREERYGFELENIKEITRMPEITPMPDMPEEIRGVIRLRENVLPLIDLRIKLGYTGLKQERDNFVSMLKQREQDHRNWLKELQSSVREKREFTLTTDPHACAFGVWYDNYKADNAAISFLLEQFDKPHKDIHNVAVRVKDVLRQTSNYDEAMAIVQDAEVVELKKMVTLFHELYDLVNKQNNEFAIIFDSGHNKIAVSVDKIDRIVEVETKHFEYAEVAENDETMIKAICNRNDLFFVLLDQNSLKKTGKEAIDQQSIKSSLSA